MKGITTKIMKAVNKVSFIVPIYNAEMYLRECLVSLQNQEGDVEIILIDDGSTDQSGEICDEFADEDNRIRVIHKRNEGVSIARNTGIHMATGNWISFVDADDWISSDFCRLLHGKLNESIDIGFVDSLSFYQNVNYYKISDEVEYREIDKRQLNLFERCLFDKYVLKVKPHLTSACAKVYRKDFLKEYNLLFDSELSKSEDALFNNYAFFYARKAIWVKKQMYYYRQHEASVTHKYDEKILETYMKHIAKLHSFLVQNEITSINKNDYYVRVTFDFMYCVINNYCNKDNKKIYSIRKKEFIDAININIFKESIKCVKMKGFSVKEKILCFCIKYRLFFCINSLYKIYLFIGVN